MRDKVSDHVSAVTALPMHGNKREILKWKLKRKECETIRKQGNKKGNGALLFIKNQALIL